METIYRITGQLWGRFISWMKEEKNQLRFILVCFVISLIPLLVLSFFNHPAMDDFNYGILTRHALLENEGLAVIPAVLKAAVQRAVNLWHSWQGTYTFAIIAALRPSIITERITFIQTFILLGIFTVGFWYFCQVMLHRLLGLSKAVAAVTSCVVMTLCIQYVPFGAEAFYWWNGSVGYTGLFSVMLILFGMLADSLRRGKISVRRMTALLALELLLAGGMYPTALLTAVVLFLVMVDGLAGKKYGRNLKIQLTVLFLLYLPEFGLSIIAPGNARRQALFQHRTPFEAIYKSYTKSLEYMFTEATNAVMILVIIALFLYMFWKLKDSRFQFRCPFMFTLVSYSMVVVMWVPGIYAVRYISGGRYYNILLYGVVLFYAANAVYYAGWLRRQYEKCGAEAMEVLQKAVPVILGTAGILCAVIGVWKVDIVTDLEEITTASALKSLVYGEAQVYDQEIRAREALYNDPNVKEVYVEEVTYRPELLYYGTLTEDPEDGRNLAMCEYYDKDFMVKIVEDTEENTEENTEEDTGEAGAEETPETGENTGENTSEEMETSE
ncbi:hypothetical protein [Lachnoclostridium sp. An138]|uniref:hypothetical protein n=1 Tax=Lachnoclostridium sp. An138 TaxID=1965560 RepID=UPI000B3A0BFE|nr:hypothetical protein [Lachnoclostridium sp. An138]OUQ16905.1 hypothetical protein B5E82_12175 [Lachnoclostridium sp. An138]